MEDLFRKSALTAICCLVLFPAPTSVLADNTSWHLNNYSLGLTTPDFPGHYILFVISCRLDNQNPIGTFYTGTIDFNWSATHDDVPSEGIHPITITIDGQAFSLEGPRIYDDVNRLYHIAVPLSETFLDAFAQGNMISFSALGETFSTDLQGTAPLVAQLQQNCAAL